MRKLFTTAAAVTATCGLGLTGLMSPSHAVTGEPLPAAAAGTVVAWGDDPGANLPSGPDTPNTFDGVQAVDVAATGNGWAAAVTPDGFVKQWGSVVLNTSGLSNVDSIAVSTAGVVALKKDKTVAVVDAGGGAQLDQNVPALTGVSAIAVDGAAAVAVAGGKVNEWGFGSTLPFLAVPTDLTDGTTTVTSVAGGNFDFTAVKSDHTAESWGLSAPAVPDDLQGKITTVAGGLIGATSAYAAVLTDGSVQAWDANGEITTPPELAGKTVVDVAVNGSVVALTSDGEIFSWGAVAGHELAAFPAPSNGVATAVAAGENTGNGETFAAAIVTTFKAATAPSIAGTAVVGETLTATPATFSLPTDSVTGQWLADGTAIPGANDPTYTLTSGDIGKAITYRSTATRGSDTVDSDSAATAAVQPFKATRVPTIAGTAQVGHTLTATPATFNATPDSVTGQWLAGGTAIPGATGTKLTLTSAYAGKHITYRSTATHGADTVTSASAPTAVVTAASKPPATDPHQAKLKHDQAKLKHDQAKLKQAKKALKKAHGHKKAKLKKKIVKLKKTIRTDKKHIAADK